MPIVKQDNVNLSKISLGEIYVATEPVPYQSIPIKYEYGVGYVSDLIIRTPLVSSSGILTNKDKTTGEIESYTLSINLTEKDEFTDLLKRITEKIKELLKTKSGQLRKNKKKPVNIDDLDIVKYKEDGSRFVYLKLYTDKDKNITTDFQIRNKRETPLISFNPLDACKRCDIKCWVGLKIESVFFNENIQTIRVKATNVIVKEIKEVKLYESIYDDDLDLFNDSSDEED